MASDILQPLSNKSFIQVKNLKKYFPVRTGLFQRTTGEIKALDDVSFSINRGETVGLVGESGCGKSTVGMTMLRLLEPTSGEVYLDGKNILDMRGAALDKVRQEMQIILQDPFTSLNPRMTVGEAVMEGLNIHRLGTRKERYEHAREIMEKVGLQASHMLRFPHEFSGGQRQRIGVARALVINPKFIVCDEPISALDVSIQSQIINLLKDLQSEFQLTYLFISHNLNIVEHVSDRVAVMYLGKLVEIANRAELYRNPLHPYTQLLVSAIPNPDPEVPRQRSRLTGDVPSPLNPPTGCRFHPRCPLALPICKEEVPPFIEKSPSHSAACWLLT